MASELIVYSTGSCSASNNFWGNNLKPTNNVSSNLDIDTWIVVVPSINDTDVVLKHDFEVSVEFMSTDDGETLNDLDTFMPDVDVTLSAMVGKLSPTQITIHENIGTSKYM